MKLNLLPPLSIYIHLPWCISKCPYCDFNSHKFSGEISKHRYLEAIKYDLRRESKRVLGRQLKTVFLGGGTPNLFSPHQMKQIITTIRNFYDISNNVEITMEANPGHQQSQNFYEYKDIGINRLSLGAQTFNNQLLSKLGRIHTSEEIYTSFEMAKKADFDNINIDLMFGLPSQNVADALYDIRELIQLNPSHASYYHLTIEPNTVFWNKPPDDIPGEDETYIIERECHKEIQKAGYKQYELSAFSKKGYECKHNINYWSYGDYIGIGAGAHGKLTDSSKRIWRYHKPSNPLSYINDIKKISFLDISYQLDQENIIFEFMLNALRLNAGFSINNFEKRTGLSYELVKNALESSRESGMLRQTKNKFWIPTSLGFRFLNDLQAVFLPS